MEPYRPASPMDLGVEINAIPKYIFIRLAAVMNHGDVLLRLVSGVRCFSENFESVYFGQFDEGFALFLFTD